MTGKQENPEFSVTKESEANSPNHAFERMRLPNGVVEKRLSTMMGREWEWEWQRLKHRPGQEHLLQPCNRPPAA